MKRFQHNIICTLKNLGLLFFNGRASCKENGYFEKWFVHQDACDNAQRKLIKAENLINFRILNY